MVWSIRASLAASPHWPAIAYLILANVWSLESKIDHIELLRSTLRDVGDCCVFIFTESWLNDNIPDSSIQLARLTCYCTNRVFMEGGKTLGNRGGGLHSAWWQNATVLHKHCSPLAEFIVNPCQPLPTLLPTKGICIDSARRCLHPSHRQYQR